MTNNNVSHASGIAATQQKLTPNEKAVIDSIRSPILRNLFVHVWQAKLRLQFTGWLQYVPPLVVTLVIFLIAGIAGLLGGTRVANGFAFVGCLLLTVEIFDLITVKFRLRPHERLPKRNDDLGLFDLMRARRSCRSFQTRKLTSADYSVLMKSVHRHTQEPRIGKALVRFEYICAPLTVWPTVNASEFLVAPGRHRRGPQPTEDRDGCHPYGLGNLLDRAGCRPQKYHAAPGRPLRCGGGPHHLRVRGWLQITVYPLIYPCF